MRPVLGIELSLSRCALVLVDDRRAADGRLHVLARRVVQYEDPVSLVPELRRVRLALGLPRRARVVVWPEPGDAGVVPADRSAAAARFAPSAWRLRERLRPLVRAGFRISAVVTPPQALALLSEVDGAPGASVAMAIDTDAGSLAAVSGGRVVVSRELRWTIRAPHEDAALVDRYAFAAQLTPHLKDAIGAAARDHGVRAERVVLCGAAPALRAIASPLIEELDVEVETLDGQAALRFDPEAGPDAIAGLQLAAAAATAPRRFAALPSSRRVGLWSRSRLVLGAVAAAAALALVLLFWPAPADPAPRRSRVRVDGLGDARAGTAPAARVLVRYAQEDR